MYPHVQGFFGMLGTRVVWGERPQTSFYPEGSKMSFIAWCLRERSRDWWEEVGYVLEVPTTQSMTRPNFVTRFRAEFAPTFEVQQLVREF